MTIGKSFSAKYKCFLALFRICLYNACEMSQLRLALGSFWGRSSIGSLTKPFRSALGLPFKYLRFSNLNAPAPAPTPYRNQFWFRAPLLLLVPAVLLVTFFAVRHARSRATQSATGPVSSLETNWQAAMNLSSTEAPETRRAVFPYSVIPGGVRDAGELQNAAKKDPVVAGHYSDFQMARAHTLRLDRPALMYVSYRLNNRVYWTRNRMTIPAGETLISDGESYARVRCGNRLSPIAALPVSVSEPPAEKLENPDWVPPLLANLMPAEGFGDFPYPTNLPQLPVLPTAGTVASGTPPAGFPPILPPGVAPLGSNTTPPPPPVPTPEPGALPLLLSGALLFGIWAFFRK
jgi:hypothetical protein